MGTLEKVKNTDCMHSCRGAHDVRVVSALQLISAFQVNEWKVESTRGVMPILYLYHEILKINKLFKMMIIYHSKIVLNRLHKVIN